MITEEKLIPFLKNYFSVDTEYEILLELKNMINEYDYSDTLEKFQDIINLLNLGFDIGELSGYGTIAYYINTDGKIIHLGDFDLTYDLIHDFINKLNELQNLFIKNYLG